MMEVEVGTAVSPDDVEAAIEACIAQAGLHITMKGTLATYPSSIHWHLKQGNERGVLELTWWPEQRRLWLSVHRNRTAPWITAAQSQLKQALEATL
jgi:hypothetical protein